MLDADGLPIIIAINTAGDGFYQLERERVSANFISSVHGKDGFSGGIENDFISNNANNNTFLFIDKEKSQNLFRVLGVQFPVRLNDFGFDNIIRQSRNVGNSKYTQNSKKDADIDGFSVGGVETDSEGNALSEAQQEFFSGSLVTDEDGALLPVYHATDSAEFTVFDKSKLGYNTDGNTSDEGMAATAHVGFWFNTKNLTGEAGSRAEKVYLNLTNPYELTSLDVLAEEIKALGEGETPAEMGEAYATDLWLRGYDGIEIRHDEEFGGTSYVAFDENQIKRTTNKNPTKDADIRYSDSSTDAIDIDFERRLNAMRGRQTSVSEVLRRNEREARDVKREFLPDMKTVGEVARSFAEIGLSEDATAADLVKATTDAAVAMRAAYLERRIANEASKDAKSRTAAKKLLEAAEMVKLPDGMSKTQDAAAMADALYQTNDIVSFTGVFVGVFCLFRRNKKSANADKHEVFQHLRIGAEGEI